MKDIPLALTYSDVLLVPKRTSLNSRSEAEVKSRFTRNIQLNIPLVSANMATVTEHRMAIALAREGGLGVIHQFCSIEEQIVEVKKVKRSTSYIIEHPVSVSPHITVGEAAKIMEKENVTSLLVEENGKLAGIFTAKDFLFEEDANKLISSEMTSKDKLITAPYGITLPEAKKILHQHRIEKLPLLEDGLVKGLITTNDIKKIEYWPNACRDVKGRLRVGAALGVKDAMERAAALIEADVDVLVLDIAHAHSDIVIQKIKELKQRFPNIDLMVGNIATGEAATDLIEAGADGLKVGIGPSPVCTTRIISGSGIPQFTAVLNVAEAAKKYNVPVCADGGIKYPGDVVKTLAAGASTIFSGNLFAGTDESPGMILMKDGRRYKKYMGSASYDSSHERQENQFKRKVKEKIDVFVEGVSILVDYKGPVEEVVKSLIKGLKSGMSYGGARNIQELQEKAEFVQITNAGWIESGSRGEKLSE
ncbi:MAG TPA: IMP dehydrogenase [Candidatus Nanoarchaeia archaeon]|nr:IMP dehydrogenase [Candidatus Nanoarchaeia archaeon]